MYAKQLLDFLNIDTDNVDELLKIPPEDLIEASREINRSRTLGTYFQSPVINDGEVIKYDPFDGAEGSEMSKNIRLISGYTKDDAMLQALFNPVYFSYTFDELPEKIVERGYSEENAKKLIEIYKKLLGSECTACDVYSSLLNDESHLMRTKQRYESRAKVGAVPMFSYVFCFESPDEDMKAIHGVDVPFFFDNAIYAPGLWNADTRVGAMKVSEDAAAAWAAFARTGDPSNPAMPVWKPYDEENKYTMLIDVESKLVTHYREEALEIILASKNKAY